MPNPTIDKFQVDNTTYDFIDSTARSAANAAVPQTRTVNSKALSADVTLTAEDIGYDSTATHSSGSIGEAITELSTAFDVLENGYLPFTIIKNSYVTQNGAIAAYPGWDRTDYIPCTQGEKLYITNTVRTVYCAWYSDTNTESRVGQLVLEVGENIIPVRSGANYFIISNTAESMANLKIRQLALYTELKKIEENVNSTVDRIETTTPQKNIINRFNKATITEGKYLSTTTGNVVTDNNFFTSDYIDVSDLDKVSCCNTHIVCFYKVDKSFVSGQGFNTRTNDGSIAIPETARYIRFSTYNTDLNTAQIGESVTRSNYVPYGKYTLPDYVATDNEIIVDVNGNGDYTSLTEALYDTVDSGTTIRVLAGTYDIHAEYIAKWGATAVDAMADSDSATFNGFQFGAIIRNRKVIFEAGSFVVCDFTYQSDGTTAQTIDGTHRMCALRMDYNAEVYGLNLTATHTFYAIHDDYGVSAPFTNIYENCYVKAINCTNANCIGGGCKGFSRHILRNCYFDNSGLGGATVRYHNTNGVGAVPEIYVYNCFFTNELSFRWYGTQTTKMRVYVNNCHAKTINKLAESSSYNEDNVELYKWCNEETDPQT